MIAMKITIKTLLMLSLISSLCTPSLWAENLWSVDFAGKSGDASSWLKQNKFKLDRDAEDIEVSFQKGRLVFATDDETLGLFNKAVDLKGVQKIRIHWGVLQYPKGADWEAGNLREPISFVLTFGTKKIDSGSFAVPDVPYFISFFLGEKEQDNKAYRGNYYKKGGRYFCTPCNNPKGKTVVTEVDVASLYKKEFGQSSVPAITGLTIEIDTRDTKGISSSFIEKIELIP